MAKNGAKRITLKDVSQLVGCSQAVVSTVVNRAKGNTLVSDETRKRVLKVAEELGYRPHFASQSLARQRVQTLGVYITPHPWSGVGYDYEGRILRGVERACQEHQYDLLLINLAGIETPEVCLRKFEEGRIDGAVLIHGDSDCPWIDEIIEANHNLVGLDFSEDEKRIDTIGFDNVATIRLATEYLVELGHRKIGFLGTCAEPIHQDAARRQTIFLKTMSDLGLPVDPRWVFDKTISGKSFSRQDQYCQLEGIYCAKHMVALGPDRPTALIAYNDLSAITALKEFMQLGLKLPDDMSIVGVDDSPLCFYTELNLTSVGQPLEDMGQRATEILIQKAEGTFEPEIVDGKPRVLHEVFAPKMVHRHSSAPPGGSNA